MKKDFLWWRDGIIYQIYPRSFYDTNHNGLGDLPGITARLDYLKDLGVDALWISPFYPSPDKDFGYDISNHVDVDPRYGSLQDFDDLLQASHERGIRIVLDLVLNHVSDQHPWFQQSRVDSSNPKQDWFLWQDSVPNKWESIFGGKAWTYDEVRGQYYYHMFVKEQPDVNWRNPDVRKAQMDVLRFWLKRGVDGFRLDVFNVYFKDEQLRDNPKKWGIRSFDRQEHIYDTDQPEMESVVKEMREIVDEYPESYLVGETFIPAKEKILRYNGEGKLHAAFDFDFLWSSFKPKEFYKAIQKWEEISEETGVFPNYVLGNHDVRRPGSRYGKGEDDARVKIVMALLLTMRGTPFIYAGDEIGMRDIFLTKRSEVQDPLGKKYFPFHQGRDGCRTPMQWDDSENAGFSSKKPWLRIHKNHKTRNLATQKADENSIFNLTRNLIALRKKYKTLRSGEFLPYKDVPKDVMAYLRKSEGESIFVLLNFSKRKRDIDLPKNSWQVLFSSQNRAGEIAEKITLFPYEILLLIAS